MVKILFLVRDLGNKNYSLRDLIRKEVIYFFFVCKFMQIHNQNNLEKSILHLLKVVAHFTDLHCATTFKPSHVFWQK